MVDRGLVEDALSCQARGQVLLAGWLAGEEASKQRRVESNARGGAARRSNK